MAKLFGRLNNLSYRGGETETANVVIDGGVIKVDVVGSPQDVTGAYIIDNKVYIKRANASPLEMALPLPQPDLAETNTESLAFVKNKKISYLENDKDYITTSGANKAYIKKVTVNNVEVPILDNDIEQVAQLLVGEGLSVGVNATVSVDTSKIATNKYVDSNIVVVTENITQHKNDYDNPHKVTKAQVGLDKVDNTADIDKPISTATKTALDTLQSEIETHIEDGNNPHQVTAEQVGLGNVNNTSDMDKPVSTSQQQALDTKVDKVEGKGLSTEDFTTELKNKLDGVENGAQVNTLTGVKGNAESEYRVGNVNITKENIGLGNVNNTSDENKPISIAQQEALDTKTNVTVNGEHVATFNADTKLDKVTTTGSDRLYGIGDDGSYRLFNIVQNYAQAGTIPRRNTTGVIVTGTPTADNHAATKKYVDDELSNKQDNITSNNTLLDTGLYGSNNSQIYNRDGLINILSDNGVEIDSVSETGEIRIQGAYNSEANPKKATTIKVHNSAYGLSINTSNIELGAASTDGTITPYLTIGPGNQVLVDTPTVERQVANKLYVDDLINTKQNKLSATAPIKITEDNHIGLNYDNVTLSVNSENKLSVKAEGLVGWGLSAPSNKLNVNIDTIFSDILYNEDGSPKTTGLSYESTTTTLKVLPGYGLNVSSCNSVYVDADTLGSDFAGTGLNYVDHKLKVDFSTAAGRGLAYDNGKINSDTYTEKLSLASSQSISIDANHLITLRSSSVASITFNNTSWVELTVTKTGESNYTGWGIYYQSSSGTLPEAYVYTLINSTDASSVTVSGDVIVTKTVIN